jgi:hypothetical protein
VVLFCSVYPLSWCSLGFVTVVLFLPITPSGPAIYFSQSWVWFKARSCLLHHGISVVSREELTVLAELQTLNNMAGDSLSGAASLGVLVEQLVIWTHSQSAAVKAALPRSIQKALNTPHVGTLQDPGPQRHLKGNRKWPLLWGAYSNVEVRHPKPRGWQENPEDVE